MSSKPPKCITGRRRSYRMFEDGGLAFAVTLAACLEFSTGYATYQNEDPFPWPPSENIVYPRILESRGLNGEMTVYIRDGLTLNLEKSRVFSEKFVFSEHDGVNRRDKVLNGNDLQKNLYKDETHGSVLFIDEEYGRVQVRGILSDKLSIEPMPFSGRAEGPAPHKISELDEVDDSLLKDYVRGLNISAPEGGQYFAEATARRKPKKLPKKFIVETRIISDRAHSHNRTQKNLIEYFALIMSKVNLYYGEIRRPRVQFVVLSIEKSTDESLAVTFPDPERENTLIDLCGSLYPFREYVKNTLPQDGQDAVVYVSGLDTGSKRADGTIYRTIVGCAFVGTVCSQSSVSTQSLQSYQPDNRDFRLIAHELGHLLGMDHEGEGKNPCQKEDYGLVMSHSKNPHAFSSCVQDQMRDNLMRKDKRCFKRTGGKELF